MAVSMDEFAREVGWGLIVAVFLMIALGRFVAVCVLIGWCWQAASWLIYRTPVEPFPLFWLFVGLLCCTPLYFDWHYERRHKDKTIA